jgi:hypothetical protein
VVDHNSWSSSHRGAHVAVSFFAHGIYTECEESGQGFRHHRNAQTHLSRVTTLFYEGMMFIRGACNTVGSQVTTESNCFLSLRNAGCRSFLVSTCKMTRHFLTSSCQSLLPISTMCRGLSALITGSTRHVSLNRIDGEARFFSIWSD